MSGNRMAHCIYYERAFGPVPEGLLLDHLCRNRDCVNPDHLEPVTCAENVQRGLLSKLTPSKVRDIRTLAKERSLTRVEIAQKFGVSPATIFAILRGQIWRNI